MRLNELLPMQRAVITNVHSSLHARRLQDLGFVPGVIVQCLRSGPFGTPLMYRLLGTNVALRKEDAMKISVREMPE